MKLTRTIGCVLLAAACHRNAPDTAIGHAQAAGPAAPAPDKGLVIQNPTSADRPYYYDLGSIPYGEKAERVFRIRNADPDPVTIQDMLPSCGCAVPRVSYRTADGTLVEGTAASRDQVIVLPPGIVADVTVKIDTIHVEMMNIDKLASVRIRSDSKSTPYLTLEIHLVVERFFRAVPPAIDLGFSPRSAGKSGRADLTPEMKDSRARVIRIEKVEGPFTATVDETQVGEVTDWILVANLDPDQPLGPKSGKVILSTTGPDGTGKDRPFTVKLSAQVVEDVIAQPPTISFQPIERGKGGRAEGALLALVPGELVMVKRAYIEDPPDELVEGMRVEVTPVAPDSEGRAARWKIALVANERLVEPSFAARLILLLDHPHVRELIVPFSGTTR